MKNNASQNIFSQEFWIISILKVCTGFYWCIFCLLSFTFGKENQGDSLDHISILKQLVRLHRVLNGVLCFMVGVYSLTCSIKDQGLCHHVVIPWGEEQESISNFSWFPPWMSYNPICVFIFYFSLVRSLVVKFPPSHTRSVSISYCLYLQNVSRFQPLVILTTHLWPPGLQQKTIIFYTFLV